MLWKVADPRQPKGPLSQTERAVVTYRYERLRALSNGILETGATVFLLLIAVRWFHAGSTAKALVAGGGSVGLLITPGVVSYVQHHGWRAAQAAAALASGGALCLVIMALIPVLPVFVIGGVLAMVGATAAIPLLTQVYQDNYPERRRGHFFSRTVMIRISVAAIFSELGGRFLSVHLDQFRWLLVIFAGAFAFSAYSLWHIPSRPLPESSGVHPFRSLRFAKEDWLFRRVLICWMIMGFANLMMLPMRVEYLANPSRGWSFTPAEVAFFAGVVPNCARLVVSPFWGWLFDRVNFLALRAVLNLGFAIGIMAFFTTGSITGLVVGGIVHGISNSGGDVAWGLWVTKFAPPNRVADYMSVHTFFTGIRGVTAPLLAFHLVSYMAIGELAWVAVSMILAATLLLLPVLKQGRGRLRAAALVEEVSE